MVNSISLAHALLLLCIRTLQHIAAHSNSPFERVEEMEGSLEEGYEIMAHFMEQGFDDPSFKVPVWSSATADSSSSYCYYYPPEVENFGSYGGFCAPHFGHGDGFYLNESDAIPQISEPAICVTAIGDLARFSEDASSNDIGQPVPPPQDPAICVTAIGDLAHFSEDASSDDIGQPVPPPQDPILQIKRRCRDSKDDVSSKTSRKAEVSWNAEKSAPLKKGQKRTRTCDKEDNNVNKTCSYSSEDVGGRQVAEQEPSTNPQSLSQQIQEETAARSHAPSALTARARSTKSRISMRRGGSPRIGPCTERDEL